MKLSFCILFVLINTAIAQDMPSHVDSTGTVDAETFHSSIGTSDTFVLSIFRDRKNRTDDDEVSFSVPLPLSLRLEPESGNDVGEHRYRLKIENVQGEDLERDRYFSTRVMPVAGLSFRSGEYFGVEVGPMMGIRCQNINEETANVSLAFIKANCALSVGGIYSLVYSYFNLQAEIGRKMNIAPDANSSHRPQTEGKVQLFFNIPISQNIPDESIFDGDRSDPDFPSQKSQEHNEETAKQRAISV